MIDIDPSYDPGKPPQRAGACYLYPSPHGPLLFVLSLLSVNRQYKIRTGTACRDRRKALRRAAGKV